MITLDTSALVAVLLGEPETEAVLFCQREAQEKSQGLIICTATITECLIVAAGKGIQPEMRQLLSKLDARADPLTEERARGAADAYAHWGKGHHPASLNFGDCFSYATAKAFQAPLLFVGDDFSKTDLKSALEPASKVRTGLTP